MGADERSTDGARRDPTSALVLFAIFGTGAGLVLGVLLGVLVPALGIASGMLVGMGIGLVGGGLAWLLLRALR